MPITSYHFSIAWHSADLLDLTFGSSFVVSRGFIGSRASAMWHDALQLIQMRLIPDLYHIPRCISTCGWASGLQLLEVLRVRQQRADVVMSNSASGVCGREAAWNQAIAQVDSCLPTENWRFYHLCIVYMSLEPCMSPVLRRVCFRTVDQEVARCTALEADVFTYNIIISAHERQAERLARAWRDSLLMLRNLEEAELEVESVLNYPEFTLALLEGEYFDLLKKEERRQIWLQPLLWIFEDIAESLQNDSS